jgi:ABC-2 type transport system permease protein
VGDGPDVVSADDAEAGLLDSLWPCGHDFLFLLLRAVSDRLGVAAGGAADSFLRRAAREDGWLDQVPRPLAGAVIVGNDFHYGSLPFYLSKPIGRVHYVLGKCLAVGLLVNLLTTLPALLLYLQAGLLYEWKTYYFDHLRQLFGILAYGVLLTVVLGLVLVAVAVSVRRTVPLVMVWTGLFVLLPLMGRWLVEGPNLSTRWRLADIWNNLYLVGLWLLDADFALVRADRNPSVGEAAAALAVVCAVCCLYLRRRVRAVDVIQ